MIKSNHEYELLSEKEVEIKNKEEEASESIKEEPVLDEVEQH